VPSCVRYGTACLLIRNTIGSVSCSVEWRMASYFVTYFMTILCESPEQHGARGDVCVGILSTTRGDRLFEKP
jgi:predicted small integral membrane protein